MRIAITTMDGMTLVRKKSLPPFRKQAHMHATALSPDQTDKRKPSAVCHIMFAAALHKCHVLLWAVGLELDAPHELRIVSFLTNHENMSSSYLTNLQLLFQIFPLYKNTSKTHRDNAEKKCRRRLSNTILQSKESPLQRRRVAVYRRYLFHKKQ